MISEEHFVRMNFLRGVTETRQITLFICCERNETPAPTFQENSVWIGITTLNKFDMLKTQQSLFTLLI